MGTITIKQGEAKTLRFTVTSQGALISLVGATLFFGVKVVKSDASYTIEKADAAFDKTDEAFGIVTVPISAVESDQTEGTYVAELKVVFTADNIDKSADIIFVVEKAVIHT